MAENRKYRIRVDGILVDVSEEVYHVFKFQGKYSRNIFLKCCSCSTVYEDE